MSQRPEHVLHCRHPTPELLPFVRVFAERLCDPGPKLIRVPLPARLEQTLEFQLGATFQIVSSDTGRRQTTAPANVVGAYVSSDFSLELSGRIQSFGIFFRPSGLSRLFDLPMNELTGRAFDASSVLGKQIDRLWISLAECRSFIERVQVAEVFLRSCVRRGLHSDFRAQPAEELFSRQGIATVHAMAAQFGMSRRHFERSFKNATGLSPKKYARVARFQSALDAKLATPARSWLNIAHHLGYHDQMHMIHDFHEFAGDSPGGLLPMIRDARPPAMGETNRF